MTTPQPSMPQVKCGAQTGANWSTEYRLWDCRLPTGHYGEHRAVEPASASWTDASCVWPELDDPWWQQYGADAVDEVLSAHLPPAPLQPRDEREGAALDELWRRYAPSPLCQTAARHIKGVIGGSEVSS